MIEECARPGSELASRIQQIWIPLFTPPPPPTYIPKEEFAKTMGDALNQRFQDVAAAVQKLHARGGKIVFVRFPNSGDLKKLEDRETPRVGIWDRVLKDTSAPGIYYEDFPRARRLQLSRMVTFIRRRLRRIQQTSDPTSSRRARDVTQ